MRISYTAVIGCGGTGQQLIPSLLRLLQYHDHGTTRVEAFDGDSFEDHNVVRQIGVTGKKTDRLNELLDMQGLDPVCIPKYVSKDQLRVLRRRHKDGVFLVIAAVDNDATRKMCIELLEETEGDFLFISPGNSSADDPEAAIKGNVLWFGRIGYENIGIPPTVLFPNIESPKDTIPREGGCMEHAMSSPQLISANALAAAYTLTVVQNFLDDTMPYEASHMFFNGRTFSTSAN